MAQVTLRDLSTNDEFTVPPEGFIFGRVGGDADIQLEDNSISRRQARVSFKAGQWLLETLAVPQGQRAPRPVSLQQGATFAIGQTEFEVLEVDAEAGEEDLEPDPAAKTFAPTKGKPGPAPVGPPKKAAPAATKPAAAPPKRANTASAAAEPAEEEAAGAGGIKGLFVGVPKGIAYYLVNVPKLLVNPMGTVRKTIDELPTEPLGKTDLIGYALPSLFISAALPSLAGGIAALIRPPHTFMISAFVPIGPAIGAVIGAVVSGFFFHRVTAWIIEKLQGTSDARSRSNYFLQMMTLAIILSVPQALSAVLGSIRFLNILAPVVTLLGSVVSLYVAYQWVLKFELVKWTQIVMKVLAALTVLGAAFGIFGAVMSSISGAGFGSPTAGVPSGDDVAAEVAEAATGDAPEELGEMPTDPKEAAEWSKKKQAQLLAKAEAQRKAAEAAAAKAQEPAEDAPVAAKDGKKDAPPADPKKDGKKAEEPKPEPEPVAVKETPPPPPTPAPKEEPVVAAPVAAGSSGYASFAHKRDAIEKLLENDPTVLQKNAEVAKLYGAYVEDAYELEKKWGKENAKKPERARLHLRLKEAEIYGKTKGTIDQLAGKLGVR